MLTEITGFSEAAVSPILLVFGGGLVAGNLLGGRLADRWLVPAVLGSARRARAGAGRHDLRHPQPGPAVIYRRPARRGRLRHRGAAADVGAGEGARRRPEPRLRPSTSPPSISAMPPAPGSAASVIDHGLGLGSLTWSPRLLPVAALARRRCWRCASIARRRARRAGLRPVATHRSQLDHLNQKENDHGISTSRRIRPEGPGTLSFGAGTFGGPGPLFGAWGNTDAKEARRLVDICLEAGVNLFDTADVYSERRLGRGARRGHQGPPRRRC